MSIANVNRGQEFMGRHPLTPRADSTNKRARIQQLEAQQLTIEQIHDARAFGTLRAIGTVARTGLHIVQELAERTLDAFMPARVAELATSHAVEVVETMDEAA